MKNAVKKRLDDFQPQALSMPQQLQVKGGEDKPIIITEVITG